MPQEFDRTLEVLERRLRSLSLETTPHGTIVILRNYSSYFARRGAKKTFVTGFYVEELEPTRPGARYFRLKRVPLEQRDEISEILKQRGYKEPIRYY